ncbi:MAG: 23S rRNA (uracil(1939)-C(5))-methyltransferase RlmD [Fusobacteria bacterium]|nr:23S rRNA (uracil(1939)-C(5))-methyltransferase RlmD [Fusobacteriota bacterium]
MLMKNNEINIKVEKIIFGGEGLGYFDDKVVFVPESVPGDELKVNIISSKKNYSRGIITEIIKSSKNRVIPKCHYFNECGACDFMMMNYNTQLAYKKEMVKEVVGSLASIFDYELYDTIASENIYHYRNKVIQAIGKENSKIISGFYKKRTHDIVDNDNCIIQPVIFNKIIKKIKENAYENSIIIYDEKSRKGSLRNVMLRINKIGEIMLVIVTNEKKYKKIQQLAMEICNSFKEIKSCYISINLTGSNVVLGKENIHIYGEKNIYENINGMTFLISPLSFFQVNTHQAEKMYNIAYSYINDLENKIVVDAYAGTGTIGAIFARKSKYVYSIELVKDACNDANRNIKINKLSNMKVINGSVDDKLIELLNNKNKVDVIIFDPPRKGLEIEIIDKISNLKIPELVYISCNPSSFARDAKLLCEKGYKLMKIQPIDMFPNTNHIEIISKFEFIYN